MTQLNDEFKTILKNMDLKFMEFDGNSQEIDGRTMDIDFIIVEGSIIILIECDDKNGESYWDRKKECWKHILDKPQRILTYVKKCGKKFTLLEESLKNKIQFKFLAVTGNLRKGKMGNLMEIGAKIWDRNVLEYFKYNSKILRKDSTKDFFYFLGITSKEIDPSKRESYSFIDAIPIISEKENKKDQTYIIWMTPEDLIRRSYVLRKDCWEILGYQRMLIEKKLRDIRYYLIENQPVIPFPTTIMVSLNKKEFSGIVEKNEGETFKLFVPDEFNSFCIIDGQHRLYSFTQKDYAQREEIKGEKNGLSKGDLIMEKYYKTTKLPILCRVYNLDQGILLKEQARLFTTINQTQTRIKTDLLYDIEEVTNPEGSKSISSKILKTLNLSGFFSNKFNIYFHEKGKLNRSSILTWGILPLISRDMKGSIYKKIFQSDIKTEEYIERTSILINAFFICLKDNLGTNIESKNFKTVASLNGFIRLIRHFVSREDFPLENMRNTDKLKEYFNEYLKYLKGKIDFKKEEFHKSSHWGDFERELVEIINNESGETFGDKKLLKPKKNPHMSKKKVKK